MYKIRDAAKLLNVETIDIHKKLISLKKELVNCTHKKNGITYIDQKGIDIISLSFADNTVKQNSELDSSKIIKTNTLKRDYTGIENQNKQERSYKKTKEDKEQQNNELELNLEEKRQTCVEEDINSLRADVNRKKGQLNNLNQSIISELQRTSNYTKELYDVQKRIKNCIN